MPYLFYLGPNTKCLKSSISVTQNVLEDVVRYLFQLGRDLLKDGQ